MKTLLYTVAGIGIFVLFGYAMVDGLEREAKRQCIVAQDHCAKYADAGACDPKYLAVCEGVEDVD